MGFVQSYIRTVGRAWLTLMTALIGVVLVVIVGLVTGAGIPRWAWGLMVLFALVLAEGAALWQCHRGQSDPPAPPQPPSGSPVWVGGDSRWVVAMPGSTVILPPADTSGRAAGSGTMGAVG